MTAIFFLRCCQPFPDSCARLFCFTVKVTLFGSMVFSRRKPCDHSGDSILLTDSCLVHPVLGAKDTRVSKTRFQFLSFVVWLEKCDQIAHGKCKVVSVTLGEEKCGVVCDSRPSEEVLAELC